MKSPINVLRPIQIVALICSSLLAAHASEESSRAAPKPLDSRLKPEVRTTWRPVGGAVEKETVTFLGVETAPVSATLSSQLSLPKDSGLVLVGIAPESPAASALKQHDVLVKLDDQLLVEPRQFSVLVRNHKEDDEVTLTYIRAGKQATARVKLGKHEVPKTAMMWNEPGGGPGHFDVLVNAPSPVRGSREETDRVLGLLNSGTIDSRPGNGAAGQLVQGIAREFRRDAPGFRAINVNPANSNLVFSDEQGSLDLTIKEGKKTLVAKNPKGEPIFSGPVNTPEERNALPPDVRDRLDKIEGMQDFTFKTDENFRPTTRTFRAFPQGIAFPPPERGAHEIHEAMPGPRVF